MRRHVPLTLLACAAIVILLTAAIPQRLNRVLNPVQFETHISTEPALKIRMLPFPINGPFGDKDLTEAEVQKLIQEFEAKKN